MSESKFETLGRQLLRTHFQFGLKAGEALSKSNKRTVRLTLYVRDHKLRSQIIAAEGIYTREETRSAAGKAWSVVRGHSDSNSVDFYFLSASIGALDFSTQEVAVCMFGNGTKKQPIVEVSAGSVTLVYHGERLECGSCEPAGCSADHGRADQCTGSNSTGSTDAGSV